MPKAPSVIRQGSRVRIRLLIVAVRACDDGPGEWFLLSEGEGQSAKGKG